MNVNLYVIEDYENEPPFGPKKTNPNKPNFKGKKCSWASNDSSAFVGTAK